MRRLAGFALVVLILAVDQGSKYAILHMLHLQSGQLLVVLPVLNFVLVWNHGITFGMFAGTASRVLLAAGASLVVLALFAWLWRTPYWLVTIAVGGIAGGAIGNVIDRLRYGAVVDFIQVHAGGLYYPWIFNIGDSAIVCGVIALMVESLLPKPPVAANRGEG
ncbi:signal peptidase II [Acidocella sp.]|uniref:signal peptidase II n=1 Tax=Acidocella sp. TaxID=50710 RepID=UPI00262B8E30|nr:signal peptidase II [Acidocella sp.]